MKPLRFDGDPPALAFDRTASFGYRGTLDYQIVVNWLIAEYKTQGLFQKDSGRHDLEEYWPLGRPGRRAAISLAELQLQLGLPFGTAATK